MNYPRIVFMGTPDFAVSSLKSLVENNFNIAAVITSPDKKSGRGRKVSSSAVKIYAESVNLNILQPTNLKDISFISALKELGADLFIVVAFRMLPEVVWNMPKMGTFNLHASLLPDYRGAAPINWAVINGEELTGVTTFMLNHKIDEGNILFQEKTSININDSVGDVHDRLMNIGSKLVVKTAIALFEGTVKEEKQTQKEDTKLAPKIFKDSCEILWDKSNIDIYNHIRGLSPYPGSWSNFTNGNENFIVKIFKSKVVYSKHNLKIGLLLVEDKSIKIAVNGGFIEVLELQIPGKKRLKAQDLLNGYVFNEKAIFHN